MSAGYARESYGRYRRVAQEVELLTGEFRWAEVAIELLGGFECTVNGVVVTFPLAAQRLLAVLSLESSGAHRLPLGQRLWPGGTQARSAANLRSAVWQVRRSRAAAALHSSGDRLWLDDVVAVDVRTVVRRSSLACAANGPGGELDARALDELVGRLRRDLLPGWDDEWLDLERERWNVSRLHSLEQLARHLLRRGAFEGAHGAALEAIALDPIREVANRLVVEIHVAEGDPGSALAHYQRYRALLHAELGVGPSALMEEVVRPLTPRREERARSSRIQDRSSARGRALQALRCDGR